MKSHQLARQSEPQTNYLYSHELDNDHYFDAEMLWERPRPLIRDKHGLRHFLASAPAHGVTGQTVFNHVEITLPVALGQRDRYLGGGRMKALKTRLEQLHEGEFGAKARYRVLAGQVPQGRLRLRFGYAIYVPADYERPLWRLDFSNVQGSLEGSADLHAAQRLLLAGQGAVTVQLPGWPFGDRQLVVVHSDGQLPEFESEPLASLDIKAHRQLPHTYCITSRLADESDLIYYLKLQAVAANDSLATTNAPNREQPSVMQTMHGGSGLPCGTAQEPDSSEQHELVLFGLALPALARFGNVAADSRLTLAFSDTGQWLAEASTATPSAVLSLTAKGLRLKTGGRWHAIQQAGDYPISDHATLRFVPPPADMTDVGMLLTLPQQPVFSISAARQVLGRQPDTPVSALVKAQPSLSRLGMSRHHCLVEAAHEGLLIQPRSGKSLRVLTAGLDALAETVDGTDRPGVVVTTDDVFALGAFLFKYHRKVLP